MPRLIQQPTQIKAAGNKTKIIQEYIGRVNSADEQISIAHMKSPSGWQEPGQAPEFSEMTIVFKGTLRVETKSETFHVQAGQAIVTEPGEWVRYSTPDPEGAEYWAVCMPAFSLETVHRDSE